MLSTEDKLKEIRSIKTGKGMQHILDKAYEVIGNPILIQDMEYKLIAHNDSDNDDPIWKEFISAGFVGYEWLVFFREECFFETAANAKICTFLFSEKLKYDRIFGKVFTSNNIQIGAACIVEVDKHFEEDDLRLFEAVCNILSLEGGKSKFFRQYGQACMETLIAKLIEGPMDDSDIYTAHFESLYNGLSSMLRIAAVEVPKSSFFSDTRVRDMLKRARPDYKYALYSGLIIIILSSEDSAFNEDEAFRGLRKYFRLSKARVGISNSFENLYELPERYKEAVRALRE